MIPGQSLRRSTGAMREIFSVSIAALLVSACASNPPSDGPLVDGSEDYKGPRTAAVAPVSDRRTGRGYLDKQLHAEVQQSIQRQLDDSGMFAGVVALDRPDEGNEAEVIIQPSLVGPDSSGNTDVDLQVLVTEKTNRRVVLDQRYSGGNRRDSLTMAARELEEDLENRYEK